MSLTNPKTSQKPVALLVLPDQGQDAKLDALFGCRGEKARGVPGLTVKERGQGGSPVSPQVAVSVTPASTKFGWYCPFLCGRPVKIEGSNYPVTVMRDTGVQKSVCRYVAWRKVKSTKAVLYSAHWSLLQLKWQFRTTCL